MKKRYARILAATLSAAMVFTSAPASVFDTGVIEAKADATQNPWTTPTLQTQLEKAAGNVVAAGNNLVAYTGSADNDMEAVADVVAGAIKNALVAINDCGHDDALTVTVEDLSGKTWKDDVTVGTKSVKFIATCSDAGCQDAQGHVPEAEVTVPFGIKAKTGTVPMTETAFRQAVEGAKYTIEYAGENNTAKKAAVAAINANTAIKAARVADGDVTPDAKLAPTEGYTVGKYAAAVTFKIDPAKVSPEGKWTDGVNYSVTANIEYEVTGVPTTLNATPASIEYKYVKDATAFDSDIFVAGKTKNADGAQMADPTSFKDDGNDVLTLNYGGINWKVKSASRAALLNAKPSDEKVVLDMYYAYTDGDQKDYTGNDGHKFTDEPKYGMVERKLTVFIKASNMAIGDVGTLPNATYKVGDAKIKLSDDSKYEIVEASIPDLTKLKVGNSANIKVTVQTKANFDENTYDVENFIKAQSELGTPVAWSYDKNTKKLSTELVITVTAKTLNASDIVFPEKLANGATIRVNDVLSNIKLEETATSKYGSFELVSPKGNATAKIDDEEYYVVFTPDADYAATATFTDDPTVNYNTWVIGKFAKKFAVTVGKKSVDSTKITARFTGLEDSYAYGTTYGDILATVKATEGTYDSNEADGKWSVKEGAANVIPMGQNTVTLVYTLKDSKNEGIDGDKASIELTTTVVIDQPVLELSVPKTRNVVIDANAAAVNGTLGWKDGSAPIGGINTGTDLEIVKSAWYFKNNSQQVYGASKNGALATLTIDSSKMMNETYYMVAEVKVKDTCSKEVKEAWSKVIGAGILQSGDCKVTVSNMTIGAITGPVGDTVYNNINATVSVKVTAFANDYKLDSISWQCVTDDGKTAVDMSSKIAGPNTSVATIPTTLDAGKYVAVATIKATCDGKPVDVASVEKEFTVSKAVLADSEFKFDDITFEKDAKIIKYGQKVSDIKFTAAKNAEKYGEYVYVNDDILAVGAHNAAIDFVKFVPNAQTKKNYSNFDIKDSGIVKISGIAVEKGELIVKAEDITITAGDFLSESNIVAKVDGLVGTDSLKSLEVNVKYSLGTVDTSKAGVYNDVLKIELEKDGKSNEKIDLDNYKVISVVPGSVIVKAKAAPVVTPTPAPVKQATAAAPKAAKAKATVKVGKKYTLKVKFAAGKKATVKKIKWTSSKKSVATVSSKGKVTAKKAGKTTITATITFKDGSKKKVKFKVTVK